MYERFQIGDWLPLAVHCRNADGTATLPDAAPTAKIFSNDGTLIETVNLPVQDIFFITAWFTHRVRLDSDYAAGYYMIVYNWATGAGANTRAEVEQFEIVAGGDELGNVIGEQWHDLPETKLVVYQLDGGDLISRRNPR